jgi:hypothetical protein
MGPLRLLTLTSALLMAASACNQPAAVVTAEREVHSHRAKEGKDSHAEAKAKDEGKPDDKADDSPQKYVVPFAWENSKAEPLALTRAFLKEAFEDACDGRHLFGLSGAAASLGRNERERRLHRAQFRQPTRGR